MLQPPAGTAADRSSIGRVVSRLRQGDLRRASDHELTLRAPDARLPRLLESAGCGLLGCRADGVIVSSNRTAAALVGGRPEDLLGTPLARWWCGLTDLPGQGQLGPGRRELTLTQVDGSVAHVEITIGDAPDAADGLWLLMLRDASERQLSQQRMSRIANYDSLTGLPNRALFRERLAEAMVQAQTSGRTMALMFLDLDNFKRVNDSLGHEAGDQLLRHVAVTLRSCLRLGDDVAPRGVDQRCTVSRLGGDEFTLIMQDAGRADDVAVIARRIMDALDTPFRMGSTDLHVSASIGISLFPGQDVDLDGLVRHTDMAMYRAKMLGRGTYSFYSADLGAEAAAKISLESDLRRALDRGEYLLHYQPKADLVTGEVTGVEALLRWHCPGRGLVSPDRFIGVLEESGLILPVGAWAIRQACSDLAGWDARGLPELRMAVNISARQFRHSNLARLIDGALQDHGVPARRLEVELTESLLLEDNLATRQILGSLAGMGVRLAMDDFGTGHSSLSYLKRFDIDTLKIDRSFVSELPHDTEDAAIAGAIVAMGQTLKMRVVAEGVETEAQADYLRTIGCNEIQGYLLSRPLAAEQFVEWLRAWRRSRGGRGEWDHRHGRFYTDTSPMTLLQIEPRNWPE